LYKNINYYLGYGVKYLNNSNQIMFYYIQNNSMEIYEIFNLDFDVKEKIQKYRFITNILDLFIELNKIG